MDLVRLAASALLAARAEHLTMKPKDAAEAIHEGYENVMNEGGLPFVLEESHAWLRRSRKQTARSRAFWKKMDTNPTPRRNPESAREALEHMLPSPACATASRGAGRPREPGRTRLVAIAISRVDEWPRSQGLAPSRCSAQSKPRALRDFVRRDSAPVCSLSDPYVQMRGH